MSEIVRHGTLDNSDGIRELASDLHDLRWNDTGPTFAAIFAELVSGKSKRKLDKRAPDVVAAAALVETADLLLRQAAAILNRYADRISSYDR